MKFKLILISALILLIQLRVFAAEVPMQTKTFVTDDKETISYLIGGNNLGRPIVLIHGFHFRVQCGHLR